jgi:hypothetical protein
LTPSTVDSQIREIKLAIGPSLYNLLVIGPLPIEFVDIKRGPFILQPHQKPLILPLHVFHLLLSVYIIETSTRLGAGTLRLDDRIRAVIAHNTG